LPYLFLVVFCALAIGCLFAFQNQISSVIAGQVVDSDIVDVTAVVPSLNPPGGGTGSTIGSSVDISGISFPNAKLTLLKDGQVATTLIANNDGTFVIAVNGLNFGNYQFSVYAEDNSGVLSSPFVVNVPIFEARSYPYSNVIIPPTISTSTTVVGAGQFVTVFGYAPAGSTVLVDIPGRSNLGSVVADSSGFYRFEVRDSLPVGVYPFRTRAQIGANQSLYSKPIFVTYFAGPVLPNPPPAQFGVCVDYNKDRRVNLIDFSILLFWSGSANPPKTIDCNTDDRIDIRDFSILMYFWTG